MCGCNPKEASATMSASGIQSRRMDAPRSAAGDTAGASAARARRDGPATVVFVIHRDHTGRRRRWKGKRAPARMRRHGISRDLSRELARVSMTVRYNISDEHPSEPVSGPRNRWFDAVLRLLRPLSFVALLLIAWHLAVRLQKAPILPGPLAVGSGLIEFARRGLLLKYIVASLFRVTWGYLAAA